VLGDGEPKYLNSPESAVFHKGTLLYLLDRARSAIRTESLAVVVEGYVDAIRLHTAGITCAVAPLGTALTPEQAKVLRRYTKQVLLAYDADAPGQRSAFRAGDELLRQGADVSVITLPPGEDPDTLVAAKGGDAFRELMALAVDVFDRKLQLLERKDMFKDTKAKRRALDRLLPTIRAASDPVTRGLYVARAAERTGVKKEVLEQEASKADRRAGAWVEGRTGGASGERTDATDPTGRAASQRARAGVRAPEIPDEKLLIQLMLSDPAWKKRAARELRAEDFRHPLYRPIAEALLNGDESPPSDDLVQTWEALSVPFGAGFDAEAAFSAAATSLKERASKDRLAEIDRLTVLADGDEKRKLIEEKETIVAELREKGHLGYRRRVFKTEREPT
jgi:DNA primase